MSNFAGLNLFESGPHTFTVRRLGRAFAPPRRDMNLADYTEDYAMRELEIEQRGRLVADKTEALAALIETIRHHAEIATTGTLTDNHGMLWPDMTMMEVRFQDRIARGRVLSVAYTVTYLRMGAR